MYNQWICWQLNCVRAMGPCICKTCVNGYNQGGYTYCNREMVHFKVNPDKSYGCWR